MINLIAFLGAILLGTTVSDYSTLGGELLWVEQVSTPTIHHTGFSSEDQRQAIIQKAYEIWWLDFVLMLECENGNWNIKAVGDWGHAFGLCQVNDRFHKIPAEYYDSWEYQLEYCYYKWSTWTKFYGPNRKIKGMACRDYVRDRFIIND